MEKKHYSYSFHRDHEFGFKRERFDISWWHILTNDRWQATSRFRKNIHLAEQIIQWLVKRSRFFTD